MTKTRALIAGGGIAGTVAGIALDKAGLEPVIAEAFDADADGVGAFLSLGPNGVRGLQVNPPKGGRIRFVTHADVSAADIEEAGQRLLAATRSNVRQRQSAQ